MEKWQEAYKDYIKGKKYKEIAEKYKVSENTVKSWASRKWKVLDKKKVAAEQKKEHQGTVQKLQKAGAPKGNQNAKGNKGGAPKGNKNNYRHGIYEKMMFELLSPEERELLIDTQFDEEEELRRIVRVCDLQIIKFMRKMKELEQNQYGLVIDEISKTKSENSRGEIEKSSITTNEKAVHDLILRYNNEIDKAKNQKMRCLEKLLSFVREDEKLELEKQQKEDSSNFNVQIYIPENHRE